jgi:hypothetical protein
VAEAGGRDLDHLADARRAADDAGLIREEPVISDGGTTNLSDTTTLEDTTVDIPAPEEPAPPVSPDLRQVEELNRCIERAGGDIDRITACFDRLR